MKDPSEYVRRLFSELDHLLVVRVALGELLWCVYHQGEPIDQKELAYVLGSSHSAIKRHLDFLESMGYVKKRRARNGVFLTINDLSFKAKLTQKEPSREVADDPSRKVAGEPSREFISDGFEAKNAENEPSQKKSSVLSRRVKLTVKDKTERKNQLQVKKGLENVKLTEESESVDKIIKIFQESFGYSTKKTPLQVRAAERLIKKHGEERVVAVLRSFYPYRFDKYCPRILGPKQLEEKWDNLAHFLVQKSSEGQSNRVAEV